LRGNDGQGVGASRNPYGPHLQPGFHRPECGGDPHRARPWHSPSAGGSPPPAGRAKKSPKGSGRESFEGVGFTPPSAKGVSLGIHSSCPHQVQKNQPGGTGGFLGLDRELGLLPLVPAAFQDEHFLVSAGNKLPCHPGTGFLVGSGAVKDESFLFGIFVIPSLDVLLRVLPYRPLNFLLALFPGP